MSTTQIAKRIKRDPAAVNIAQAIVDQYKPKNAEDIVIATVACPKRLLTAPIGAPLLISSVAW